MTLPMEENDPAAVLDCQKHQVRMRAALARCADPELYCRFRPSCLIHLLDKERTRLRKSSGGGPASDPPAE
jgi:hypothetical protein